MSTGREFCSAIGLFGRRLGLWPGSIAVVVAVAMTFPGCASRAPVSPAPSLDCAYASQLDREIGDRGPCAYRGADSKVRIDPAHLERLSYSEEGLGSVWVNGVGWIYVKRDGETLEVLALDNGPDPFAEGLVRGLRNGKVAYFDRSFRMVIAPRYDFGWPFSGGRARVCLGCRTEPADPADFERHLSVVGGEWGFIDLAGREVVPVRYPRDRIIAP